MTKSKIRAVYILAIWGTAALVFLGVFFLGGGPVAFADTPLRILVSALAILLAYSTYGFMLRRTRLTPADERDAHIAARANETAFISVMVFVFLVSIILYESYDDAGVLPVGWMWFMAYFTGCFGYIAHAVVTLILHREMSAHG